MSEVAKWYFDTSINIIFYENEGILMNFKQNKKIDSPNKNSDSILNEFKRIKEKDPTNSVVTGRDSAMHNNMNFKRQHVNRIISILTQFSLVLGFIVFLILWLL